MIGEFDIGGVFLPAFLLCAIVGFLASLVLRRLLRMVQFYSLVWHAGLFDVGLFVVLWWGVSMLTANLAPYVAGVRH